MYYTMNNQEEMNKLIEENKQQKERIAELEKQNKEKNKYIDELMKDRIENENIAIFNMVMLEFKYGVSHWNRVKEEFLTDKYDDIDSLIYKVNNELLDCQKTEFFKYLKFDVYEDEEDLLESHKYDGDSITLESLQDEGYFIMNTMWSDELLVLDP